MRALVLGRNITLLFNVVWALAAAGIEAEVLCDWFAPRVRYSRHCRHYTRVPSHELTDIRPAFVDKLKLYCRTRDIDIVIPADLGTTLGLGRVNTAGLRVFPFADPETLETLHDKWRFHELLQKHALPSPRTRLLDRKLAESGTEQTYPLLIKPALGEGSRDITRCDTPEQLVEQWAKVHHLDERYLVQEHIPGHDIDLSLLADRGRIVAHTIQQDERTDVKRFVEDERMLRVAQEVTRATQFHGLAHFDMRIDSRNGDLYVLECNPRVWGSLMYSVWAGVNFIDLGVRMAMGQRVPTVANAPTEHVWHQGVAPRRLLEALLHGRTAPEGMTGATLASWRQVHTDPLTQLVGGLTEPREDRLRKFFSSTYESAKNRAMHS